MQIAYHLGAHGTDGGRLVRSLLKDRALLLDHGIAVPMPKTYRQALVRIVKSLGGAPASAEAQQVILDAVLEGDAPERLIFSHENLICYPSQAIRSRGLYAGLAQRVAALANLFPDTESEFFLAICNPALLVPALVEKVPEGGYENVMGGADPLTLRWAPAIRRVFEAVPDARLTVWCSEDMPLLWPDILRALTGLEASVALEGDLDMAGAVLLPDGLMRLQAFLAAHPPRDAAQWRRAVSAFLDKYADPESLEQEVELPGWTAGLVEEMTRFYLADCAEVAAIPGVRFLAP
ncbi:hypothetical protein [Albidovulum sp.]